MNVIVYATSDKYQDKDIKDKLVVVVDVLRATSTIITALSNGCKDIIPVTDIEDAVNMSRNYEKNSYLLCGERNIMAIEGFDLSNSPLEYTQEAVCGKTLLMTTTNGTRAIQKAGEGREVIIGSLLNAQAVADYIKSRDMDVVFACAGTDNNFSLDDIAAVGAIISCLVSGEDKPEISLSDLAFLCYDTYNHYKNNLVKLFEKCAHYNRMVQTGLMEDIEYCLKINTVPVVGVYKDGVIIHADKVR